MTLLDRYPLAERYQDRSEGELRHNTSFSEIENPRFAVAEANHMKVDSGALGNLSVVGTITLEPLGQMGSGQTAYDQGIGWFFDVDATNGPRFSIGDSSPGGSKLLWDGNTLSITGTVEADDGEIGGWIVGPSQLTGGDVVLDSSGFIRVGDANNVAVLSSVDATYRIWAGNASGNSAPFRIGQDGSLVSTKGTIGGWDIADTTLTSEGIILDSGVGRVYFGEGDYIGDNRVHFEVGNSDTVTTRFRNPDFIFGEIDEFARISSTGPVVKWKVESDYNSGAARYGIEVGVNALDFDTNGIFMYADTSFNRTAEFQLFNDEVRFMSTDAFRYQRGASNDVMVYDDDGLQTAGPIYPGTFAGAMQSSAGIYYSGTELGLAGVGLVAIGSQTHQAFIRVHLNNGGQWLIPIWN